MKVFLAGIIQGSRLDGIHPQEYRDEIRAVLRRTLPDVEVFCPIEHHPASLDYPDEVAARVFFELLERAAQSDVLIAFVPEASMGTAVELWRARENNRVVLAVTPLTTNWAVKFLCDRLFPDAAALAEFIASEDFRKLLAAKGVDF